MWVNEEKTLTENRNKDTWQLPVVSQEGDYWGNVISQIVQPHAYMVRYMVVYSPHGHFLLPSDTVEHIEDKVYSSLPSGIMEKLPAFEPRKLTRETEETIYQAISQAPYWESER